ncbi:MAG: D-alanyl-D-alanine carboxypeptidase family protein [Alphaproteobacteria bacterium]|nr:D-alanyl-D-alanine carboxypeptidase family protein [Alphaproteobacteria bacterium]
MRSLGIVWRMVVALVIGGSMTAAMAPPVEARTASLVMDAATGEILHASNPDLQLFPASLTKMMTIYLAFEAVRDRKLSWESRLPVSAYAASMSPTKLGLSPGERITLEDAVLGLMTKSANDAAVVVAEALAGSEAQFARLMTQKARRLGMGRTQFQNASGLPDPGQVSTARDMGVLGRALIRDFPTYYPMFATRGFTHEGRWHGNHNALLGTYAGADGIKTGFIRASGYNLVASAQRGNRRLIGVVFGGQSSAQRNQTMMRLLDRGFGGDFEDRPPPASAAVAQRSDDRRGGQGDGEGARIVRTAMATPAVVTPPQRRAATPPAAPVAARPVAPAPAARPQPAPAATPARGAAPAAARGGWAIQVGAFAREPAARAAATNAQRQARLPAGQVQVTEVRTGGANLFRARVAGLSEGEARAACRSLERERMTCAVSSPR